MEVDAPAPKANGHQIDPGATDGSGKTTHLPGLLIVECLDRIVSQGTGLLSHRSHLHDRSLPAYQGEDVKLSAINWNVARYDLHAMPLKHMYGEILGVTTQLCSR